MLAEAHPSEKASTGVPSGRASFPRTALIARPGPGAGLPAVGWRRLRLGGVNFWVRRDRAWSDGATTLRRTNTRMLLAQRTAGTQVVLVRDKFTGNREQGPRSAAREQADKPAGESRRVLPFWGVDLPVPSGPASARAEPGDVGDPRPPQARGLRARARLRMRSAAWRLLRPVPGQGAPAVAWPIGRGRKSPAGRTSSSASCAVTKASVRHGRAGRRGRGLAQGHAGTTRRPTARR